VAFSGVTVGIGLLALVVLPIPFLQSLGYAGILIPLVSVVVAVTLLPALLAMVGSSTTASRWAPSRPLRSWSPRA
jgi:putative drug exporter of the RND superfamily